MLCQAEEQAVIACRTLEIRLEKQIEAVAAAASLRAATRPAGAVADWSVADVARWLGSLGDAFVPPAQAFVANAVDGRTLLALTDDLLKDTLGVSNPLVRARVLRIKEIAG
jgi:SAM domain (Sterile alpha motif)